MRRLVGAHKVTNAEREQIKLRAAAIDRVSTACTTIGVLAPLAGAFFGGAPNIPADSKLFLACVIYLGAALVLHHAAIYVLDGLEE
jgi:hypothetical protein